MGGRADRPGQPRRWPEGTRLICRRERPHPGAQLSFTDLDGHRFQCFITDQAGQDIAALEATHRQHAQVEDRVKTLKATGASHLPFHAFRANAAWLELALTAHDMTRLDAAAHARRRARRSASPSGCATASCTSPGSSPATPAESRCTYPPTGPGPARSCARSSAWKRSPRTAERARPPLRPIRRSPGNARQRRLRRNRPPARASARPTRRRRAPQPATTPTASPHAGLTPHVAQTRLADESRLIARIADNFHMTDEWREALAATRDHGSSTDATSIRPFHRQSWSGMRTTRSSSAPHL